MLSWLPGERSEKGWLRYQQKELLSGRSNKQYLVGPLPYFLQITDLFFRPLLAFALITRYSLSATIDPTRSPIVLSRNVRITA